ncbi:MAG: adenylate kinase [Bacteroidota bacterium]
MVNIVLFGPPGAGKGTQSKLLIEEYGFDYICPGDIFRKEVQNTSSLGKKVQAYIDQGKLAPNELVIEVVADEMKNSPHTSKGFLFDGYPRTYAQANALDQALKNLYKSQLLLVVALEVDTLEMQKRIEKRSKVLLRADDQSDQTIALRFKMYEKATLPVLDYYEKQKKIARIKGHGSIDEVASRIKNAIQKHTQDLNT